MIKKVNKVKQAMVLACCLAVRGCKQAPQANAESGYKVMILAPADRTLSSAYSATVCGRQDIEIYPQVGGTLTQVCVNEGERVKRGWSLFVIDQVPYKVALQTALANVEVAKASLTIAQLTYDSKQESYRQNIASALDMSTAKSSPLAAQARLAQMKTQEVNARDNLSYTSVKSPADGAVGALPYRVEALMNASLPEPLAIVSDNLDMCVYFSMTKNQFLGLIRRYGSKKEILKQMLGIGLQPNDRSDYLQAEQIETINGVINRTTGTVSLRAMFPNRKGLLHNGGARNVIVLTGKTEVLVIPQAAAFGAQDKIFVYKVVDGKAQSAPVQMTRVGGRQEYIVGSRLQTGDVVVVGDVGLLREGAEVRAMDEER